MGKPRKPTAAERRESAREHAAKIAGMPDTVRLFRRCDVEPHVKSLRVTEAGIRIEFQALHPLHAHRLMDAMDAIRQEAGKADNTATAEEG